MNNYDKIYEKFNDEGIIIHKWEKSWDENYVKHEFVHDNMLYQIGYGKDDYTLVRVEKNNIDGVDVTRNLDNITKNTFDEIVDECIRLIQGNFQTTPFSDKGVFAFIANTNTNREITLSIDLIPFSDGNVTINEVANNFFPRVFVKEGEQLIFDLTSQSSFIAMRTRRSVGNVMAMSRKMYNQYKIGTEHSIFRSGRTIYVLLDDSIPENEIILFLGHGKYDRLFTNHNDKHTIHPNASNMGVICVVGEKSYRDG